MHNEAGRQGVNSKRTGGVGSHMTVAADGEQETDEVWRAGVVGVAAGLCACRIGVALFGHFVTPLPWNYERRGCTFNHSLPDM